MKEHLACFSPSRKVSPILMTTDLVHLSVNLPVFIHTDLTVWVFNNIISVLFHLFINVQYCGDCVR